MILFDNIEAIKKFMKKLGKVPTKNSKVKENCEWFSSVNYTTLSEYVGELSFFVDELLEQKEFSRYKSQLLELKRVLERMFSY